MTALPSRRLAVLRHAKSAWPDDVADHERPLAARGRRDAPAAGRRLREMGCAPGLVVCSTARRTRQTWDLVAPELAASPPVVHDPRVYDATVPELLNVIREVPDRVETLLLIGHNPGAQELVLRLAGEAADDALQQARVKFPTAAIAVLTWQGTWAALAPGTARLTDFAIPRGLRGAKP
jgi:phosphohistidine phosphatase